MNCVPCPFKEKECKITHYTQQKLCPLKFLIENIEEIKTLVKQQKGETSDVLVSRQEIRLEKSKKFKDVDVFLGELKEGDPK